MDGEDDVRSVNAAMLQTLFLPKCFIPPLSLTPPGQDYLERILYEEGITSSPPRFAASSANEYLDAQPIVRQSNPHGRYIDIGVCHQSDLQSDIFVV